LLKVLVRLLTGVQSLVLKKDLDFVLQLQDLIVKIFLLPLVLLEEVQLKGIPVRVQLKTRTRILVLLVGEAQLYFMPQLQDIVVGKHRT
jgi:hypothetical protein